MNALTNPIEKVLKANLLLDVGAIKTGGGTQLALNFLDLLQETKELQNLVLLIPQTGPLAEYPYDRSRCAIYYYPSNYIARYWFEQTQLKRIYKDHQITHIFTFFGAGLPKGEHIKSTVSTAYPIICYPDSKFWRYADSKTRLRNIINNYLRRTRLKSASKIIVETQVMSSRIAQHLPYDANKIHILPPVPSRYIQPATKARNENRINFLCVSGCDPHKNLWRLPELAQELEAQGLKDFQFTITTDRERFRAQKNLPQAAWQETKQYFDLIGAIHPRDIQRAYDGADYLINLSDLESFSNNYMEAWKAGIPLIASDRDFARNICGDSAIYIEPHNPQKSAQAVIELINNQDKVRHMVRAGRHFADNMGDIEERFRKVMQIVLSECA